MTKDELLSCLTDRPCEACKFHTEFGCSKWSCVFEGKTEEWIPCEERLPREDELILVNVIHPDRVYPIILCIGKDAYAMAEHGDINAWMPLPKPYEGRTE